jgi:hypothetical protein
MATEIYETGPQWSASARYTASSDVDVLISNPSALTRITFTITQSDTVPTTSVTLGSLVPREGSQDLALESGDRLWLASPQPASAAIEV